MKNHRVASILTRPTAIASLAALVLTVLLGGCNSVEQRTYSISVKNDSLQPVTVWLTKTGGVYESSWKSPEDLAIESRSAGEPVAGMVIQPGKTAAIDRKVGKFYPNSNAVLRVYLGEHTISGLLSIGKDASDRRDYDLAPGYNNFNVVDKGGQTLVQREKPVAMATEGK